jgi:hypothetical protein
MRGKRFGIPFENCNLVKSSVSYFERKENKRKKIKEDCKIRENRRTEMITPQK